MSSPIRICLRPVGTGLLLTALLLAGLLTASNVAADSIFKFIDDRGVVHFSDARHDSRYSRVPKSHQEGIAINPEPWTPGPGTRDYDRLIAKAAGHYGIQPALIKAVIAAESNFKPDAVSRVGAQGLMQLMPATARELGVERPFGVIENIDGGVRYLREMLDRFGDVSLALAAYNAGPRAVDKNHGVPPYRETQAYVKRVLEYYRGYRPEFEDHTERAEARPAVSSR